MEDQLKLNIYLNVTNRLSKKKNLTYKFCDCKQKKKIHPYKK